MKRLLAVLFLVLSVRAFAQTTPTITWNTPSPITYGIALSATQLNATANVAGTFSYSPDFDTVLPPGVETLTGTFTPDDTADYTTASASVTLRVLAIPPAGFITTYAGSYSGYGGDGGPAVNALMQNIDGVAIDSAGNVYISDTLNSAIRKVTASTGIISTIAGNGTAGYSGDGGPAIDAQINWPRGIAVDAAGNVYFTDGNQVIRKISSSGIITTVAGKGGWDYSGDGGPAINAQFAGVADVAVDSAGNLYIADSENMVIRKVWAATGIITTVAGNGTAGYSGDGGAATAAELNWPFGVAVDPIGNLYIGDLNNNVVRKVDASTGIITTFAGNGTQGYSGDHGPAANAELYNPIGVTFDAAGNLYIADSSNNVVREVAAGTGAITTIAGNGTGGFSGDGGPATSAELNTPFGLRTDASGNIFVAEDGSDRVRVVGSSATEPVKATPVITWTNPPSISYGVALSATQLDATANVAGTFSYSPAPGAVLTAGLQPLSVIFTPDDTAHYTPAMATVPITVTQVTPTITWPNPSPVVFGAALSTTQLNATANVPGTFVYTPDLGTALEPGTYTLSATFTPADTVDYAVVTAAVTLVVQGIPSPGIITTIAGNGAWEESGDNGLAIEAGLKFPEGIALDSAGNLYIPDSSGGTVRKVSASTGEITTIAGTGTEGYSGDGGPATSAQLNNPMAVAVDAAGNVYIADFDNSRIRKITVSTGIITTVAGTTSGYSGDGGPATSAQLSYPMGLSFDSAGNLYISDTSNNRIRQVSATGIITTIAGNGNWAYSGDGGPATSAGLDNPIGINLDSSGNLYIADAANSVVRKVTASTGVISTIAGTGVVGNTGDGGPATDATLNAPLGVAVDASGNIFIVDYNADVVRRVSAADGAITTVAGNGTGGFSGDGGPATSAQLSYPHGLALDPAGNLYIADCGNNRVRIVGGGTQAQVTLSVSPTAATLYSGQQATFTATVTNTTNTAVSWSLSPVVGAISSSGIYTAPSPITTQQTITITAQSQANPSATATATVTLVPSIAVTVSPATATLYAGQAKQFSATVTNTSNAAVRWSISPVAGVIDSSGHYIAPSSITTQQTITVTAQSQADGTTSGTATITLMPTATLCGSNGYRYARAITIDHTKIPNTDQTNFPVLFSTIDPLLATTANGGHVANGNDIIFTSDPAGQNLLDYEIEKYDAATGQVIAWIKIPTLSHTTDTVIYLFYGKPTVTTSQQNPAGVWDSNYVSVWHLPNGTSLSVNDSTANADSSTPGSGVSAAAGFIDGGASFNGAATASINIPASSSVWNLPSDVTVSAWIKSFTDGRAVVALQNNSPLVYLEVGATTVGGTSNKAVAYFRTDTGGLLIASGNVTVDDNEWHNIQAVRSTGNSVTIYVDGVLDTVTPYSDPGSIDVSGGGVNIGFGGSNAFNGLIDEVRISKTARSADWIATEYANQSSPTGFYSISSEGSTGPGGVFIVTPATATLHAGQSQTLTAMCNPVSWSIPPAALGSINGTGTYTAPSSITSPQSIVITAASVADPTVTGAATVTLLPAPLNPTITLTASAPSPYVTGSSETFVATTKNHDGTPLPGETVSFTVTGPNARTGSGITDGNGNASFTYTGASSGTDTIEAAATVDSVQVTSGPVTAVWLVPTQSISTSTVYGAFFSTNGTCAFDPAQAARPAFTETFPTINFNPPAGTIPGNTSSVNVNSRPFTDVTTDLSGNYTGTIIAEGNGYQAGVGPMGSFEAVFTGEFTVASAGNAAFNFYDDDGFIFGIANGATRVSGVSTNMPAASIFNGYPSMGADNAPQSPTGNQVVVNFPAAGTYPYEVDYTECDGGQLVLTMTQGATSPTGVAPTGSLALSPNSINPLPLGGSQLFTVLATDAAGSPVQNAHVGLVITGVDDLQLSGTTDSSGHATIVYNDANPGTAYAQAVAFVSGMVTYSNMVTVPWTQPSGTATGTGTSGSLTVSLSAPGTINLPNTLQLTGSATDSALPQGDTISYAWSQVSGSGTVTFANAQQASTAASFSQPGIYQLQLAATDVNATTSAQITVTVNPQPGTSQGWIGSPQNGALVSGIVPINVASGETLTSCVLTVYPANNPSAVTPLNCNTTGSSNQIGTWDTTGLNNGTYWITLQGTDSNNNSSYNLALVTVVGNYKPGRVTSTVTDLVVPATGLAINIQRTYDSLNANTSGDFGYGWNLGINVNLSVDNKGNVTFALGGQRKTFYLTPQIPGCSPLVGCLFPWFYPVFTPEPGLHGTLTDSSPGCPLDIMLADGECIGGGFYNPPGYIYTDPNGTAYTISATGGLQSIVDRSGNGLTITPNGITSTTGLNVPFVRDSQHQNRITQITDPQGNVYSYSYDTNGNLASVTYPQTSSSLTCSGAPAANTSQYTYYPDSGHPDYPAHYYAGGTDALCHPLPSTTFFGSTDMDASGKYPVAGKLASVTDALGEETDYAYNLSTNTTTITYPPDAGGTRGTATMVYDGLGDLTKSTDPLSKTTTNTYDANRNLLSTTDPLGNITCYTYDTNGNRTSASLPQAGPTCSNIASTTAYNQFSEPISTTDEDGNTRSFNYDVNFNPQSVTDGLGTLMSTVFNPNGTMQSGAIGFDISQAPAMASQFTYDADGNLASKTDALNRATSYTYNSLGQKLTMVEPIPSGSTAADATTTYSYDPFGNLTQTSAPLSRVTSSTYDDNGNKTSDTDANNNVTHYKYDALNRLIETDYPTSPATSSTRTYDFRNNVIDETDQNGHVTHHVYDTAGRETSVTQAYGTSDATTISYTYYDDGRKHTETDALSHTTTYTYDPAGNLTGISGVKGAFTYAYDNARNRISMTDGDNNKTTYLYDARKRLIETDYPDGSVTKNTYDGPGNLASVTVAAGTANASETDYTYDAANQLVNVVQSISPGTTANSTGYGYDPLGNPDSLVDANSHQTIQNFNLLSEMTGKTLPDGTLNESRTYYPNGELHTITHFNGTTTTYTYDQLNRLSTRSTPGEATVSFTYTNTGKRHTMTDASGTTTYGYDAMDRLTSKATQNEGTLSYTYDAAGNLATMTSSNAHGVSVSYQYDSLNRLSAVVDNNLTGSSNTTNYTYDTANNVATVTYPNTVQSTFTYDPMNRLTGLSSQPATYNYHRDFTGNLTTASESHEGAADRNVSWGYDGIYRLTNETISLAPSGKNGSVGYGLDPVGNRTSATSTISGLAAISGTFNQDDELASEGYDANGNVTSAGGKTFSYDSQNQLVSINGGAVQIVYDGDGNRVSKTVLTNGVPASTYYLVDDLNPTGYPQVVEELQGAIVTRQYTYGLQRIDENQFISNQWTPSFYGYDGGGNVRQLTNSAGTVTDTYEYDAYGNEFTVSGSTPNEMMYRGEQYDSDLGLYYLRARYYNPLTGRFMSRDPQDGVRRNPATLHKYLYTGGDPVNRIDPSGRIDLETYGIKITQSLTATVVINTISCGIQFGLAATTGGLYETFGNDPTGTAFAAFGCLTVQVSAQGKASVVLDAVSLAGCGWGLYLAYQAENDWFQQPTNDNLRKVAAGLVGSFGSCATSLFAIAAEP